MQSQLNKAINLVRKTGDRLIVVDSSKPDEAFVVMNLDEYEKLVVGRSEVRGLTEDELLDKINRDIAIWKSEQETVLPARTDKPSFRNNPLSNSEIASSHFDDANYKEDEDEIEDNLYYYNEEDNHDNLKVNPDYPQEIGKKEILESMEADKESENTIPVDGGKSVEEKNSKNVWKIPPVIKEKAEEVIDSGV